MLHPVILSGGSGTRLWPLSRRLLPKQLLPLLSERTLLQETAARLAGIPNIAAPILVCTDEQRFLVAEQMREAGVTPSRIFLEPQGRNTAPAACVAALSIAATDPQGIMLVLPADHLIRDVAGLHAAIARAGELAASGRLVAFGVVPDRPATGYGYMELTDGAAEAGTVKRFVEKPDAGKAREFVSSGRFFWNSGMFVFTAGTYLQELERYRPDILVAARESFERSQDDLDFCRLDARAFANCPAESIDYAVMEKTGFASMVRIDIGWSDIGSWEALWEAGNKDDAGNVTHGKVYLDGVADSYVRAENSLVAVIGVRDLIVVETADAVLVTHKDHAQRVKQMVESLSGSDAGKALAHRRIYRPWGYFENIDAGNGFVAKRLMVKPGSRLSLQVHRHRAEHWVVVSGKARVTRGEEIIELAANQSTYIPLGTRHRLENAGSDPLFLIEVQSGEHLSEDDIERIQDDYRRD